MEKRFGKDLTVGNPARHLLMLALPMLLGNILQAGYSIVNTIWIGHTIGKEAVGAAAVTFPIIFVLIALAAGATIATSILVAQFYGAKNDVMVKRVVRTSFTLALIMGTCLSLLGIVFGDAILKLMQTPETVFVYASPYLKISAAAFLPIYFSFLMTAILRGIGDTKTPLIFVGIGVLLNAILDPFFILGIGPFPKWGLNGAGVASLISSTIAAIAGLVYLNKKGHVVSITFKSLKLDGKIVPLIFKIGLPSMIQQALISLGGIFVTSLVNQFGSAALAAFGAAARVEAVAFMPALSIGMATSALAGQNIGANKLERIPAIFKAGMILTCAFTLLISVIMISFPHQIMAAFVNDVETINIGVGYINTVSMFYFFFAIMFVSNGIINGAGHTIKTMIFTLAGLWAVRVPMATYLSHTSLGIKGIWIGIVTGFFVGCFLSVMYYISGGWRKKIIRNTKIAEIIEA